MNSPKRPRHAGLHHVALNVLDLALVEQFYVQLMGFEVEWRPDSDNVYLCSGTDNLALHSVRDTGNKAQKLDHIGIIIDDIKDVDAWYEFLSAHDVKMASQPKTHRDGARGFYCYDPEGTVIQMLYHPPLSDTELD